MITNKSTDLRIQKTKTAIFQAFEEMLEELDFEKITVTALCKRAQTRPATFYNHFSDKYDCFDQMIAELRFERLDQAAANDLSNSPDEFFKIIFTGGFTFLEEHASLVEKVESNSLLTTIMHTSSKELEDNIRRKISQDFSNQNTSTLQKEIITQSILGASVQVSRWWFENRQKIDKNEAVDQLVKIIIKMY
ncbi:TetR/AcrR family transcriptional regulator [Streptococcaceae bacterium ESL0687]|nr:TetR/AcrR family transcriptional regulator [Streptococcaceae bacterium ESL0687]